VVTIDFEVDKHYVIINQWWRVHGSFPPKIEHLPKTGFIVEADGKPTCAGFVYKTDSSICVFEFVVSNPDASKQEKDDCLKQLISSVKSWSKENGFSLIYSSIGIPKYIKRLQEQGFVVADEKQTHIFCEV
jgi:predicted ATP-grasp superfamily ATP-dependent carboligase